MDTSTSTPEQPVDPRVAAREFCMPQVPPSFIDDGLLRLATQVLYRTSAGELVAGVFLPPFGVVWSCGIASWATEDAELVTGNPKRGQYAIAQPVAAA